MHVVPTPYNGQFLGEMLLEALCVGLAALVIARWTGRWHASIAVPVCLLAVAVWRPNSLAAASTWTPHTAISLFLLFVIAGASLLVGRWRDLWIFVLAGGLLAQNNVSLLFFVAATTGAVALVLGVRTWRARPRVWPTSRDLWWAGVVAALLAAPMVANVVLHWPGDWVHYWDYGRNRSGFQPRTVGDIWRFGTSFWTIGGRGWKVTILVAFLVTLALLRFQSTAMRRFLMSMLAMVAFQFVLVFIYVWRGVDILQDIGGVGWFAYALPVVVFIAAIASLTCATVRWAPVARAAVCVGMVVAVVGVFLADSLVLPYRGTPAVPKIADAVEAPHVRVGFALIDWPLALAIVEELRRRGVDVCVENREAALQATPGLECRGPAPKGTRSILVSSTVPPPAGATPIYQQPGLVVTTPP
jgi:hypothetical protein